MIDGEREDRTAAVVFSGLALAFSLMALVLAIAAFVYATH